MNEMRSTSAQPYTYYLTNNRFQLRDIKQKDKSMNYDTNQSDQYSHGHYHHHHHHQQEAYLDRPHNNISQISIDPTFTKNISYSRRRIHKTDNKQMNLSNDDKGPGFRNQHESHPLEAMFENMMMEQDNITRRLNNNNIYNNNDDNNNNNNDYSNPLDYMLVNMIMEQDNVTKRLNKNIMMKYKLNYMHLLKKLNNTELYTPMTSTELNANSQSVYNGKRHRIRTRNGQ